MPVCSYRYENLLKYVNKIIRVNEIDNDCVSINANYGSIVKLLGTEKGSDINKTLILDRFHNWFKNKIAEIGEIEFYIKGFNTCLTTPETVCQIVQQFNDFNGTIIDPCMGYGGHLLVAMILCGADPKKIYGIELDPDCYAESVKVLTKFGVPKENLHLGSCLDIYCYDFDNKNYHYPYNELSSQEYKTFLENKEKIYQYRRDLYSKEHKLY